MLEMGVSRSLGSSSSYFRLRSIFYLKVHHRPGRHRRWEEPLTSALGNCWKSEVLTKGWFAKAGEFVQKTYKDMHLKSPEDRYGRPILRTQEEPTAKRRRVVLEHKQTWAPSAPGKVRLLIQGDSLLTIQWMKGVWEVRNPELRKQVAKLHDLVETFIDTPVEPPTDADEIFKHVYREFNERADALARNPADSLEVCTENGGRKEGVQWTHLRACFDGSCMPESCGCGWWMEGRLLGTMNWRPVARASWKLPLEATAVDCEIMGLQSLLAFLSAWLSMNVCSLAWAKARSRPTWWVKRGPSR